MPFDPSINYLDLYDILVHEVLGGLWIFVFVGIGLIAIFGLKWQMPYQIIILSEILFLLIVAAVSGITSLWAFAVLAIGGISYYLITRSMSRG